MKSVSKIFLFVSVLALAVFSIPMLAQNQTYPFPGYPPEFAPSRTVRTLPPAPPIVPPAKFTKLENAVPNQYIVVLKDDAVSTSGTAVQRRARIGELAKLMLPIGAEIQSVYSTVLRGFCVKLPSETAAIALSKDPRVKYVESDVLGSLTDCPNITDQIGLDRIDQVDLPLDGCYTTDRTGSGVTVYDVDTGLRTTHQEFGSRAFLADDEVAADSITDHCTVTSTNNDCSSHGTAMMGVVGGSTYGVAKAASLGAVKVSYQDSNNQQVLQGSRVIRGIDWITTYHNDHPTQLAVANCSFQFNSYTPLARIIHKKAQPTFRELL